MSKTSRQNTTQHNTRTLRVPEAKRDPLTVSALPCPPGWPPFCMVTPPKGRCPGPLGCCPVVCSLRDSSQVSSGFGDPGATWEGFLTARVGWNVETRNVPCGRPEAFRGAVARPLCGLGTGGGHSKARGLTASDLPDTPPVSLPFLLSESPVREVPVPPSAGGEQSLGHFGE